MAARLVLNAIADAAGVPNRLDLGTLGDEPLEHERIDALDSGRTCWRANSRAFGMKTACFSPSASCPQRHGRATERFFPAPSIRSMTVIGG